MKTPSPHVRRGLLVVAFPIGLVACGSSSSSSKSPAVGGGPPSTIPAAMEAAAPLLGFVASAVPGLSTSQAATGVGSLLGLAQAKMPVDQFIQISNTVPGTNALINGAVDSGLPTSGLNSLSSLTVVFDQAGISPIQVSQMIPFVGDAISNSAGPSVAQSFLSAVQW